MAALVDTERTKKDFIADLTKEGKDLFHLQRKGNVLTFLLPSSVFFLLPCSSCSFSSVVATTASVSEISSNANDRAAAEVAARRTQFLEEFHSSVLSELRKYLDVRNTFVIISSVAEEDWEKHSF